MSTGSSSKAALALACAALVTLSGCATTRSPVQVVLEEPAYSEAMPGAPVMVEEGVVVDPTAATENEEGIDAVPPPDTGPSSRLGSGKFIDEKVAARAPAPAGATGEVTFNFEGESLHAVIKAILGDFLQQNYVIAPGVQGNVTFSTAKPLRGDQALSILEMLLRWNNATLVWQDGRYTILPVAQALPGNLTPRVGPAASARGYEVRAVPLQFISALEMEKLLKPYAKPEGVVNVDPQRNMIVLAGTRAELENYLQTIRVFDVDWLAGMSVGVFTLEQAEAAKTVTDLEKIFGEGSNTPLAGMFRFMPLEGVNAVMVITPQPKYLDTVEEWLRRLDLGGGEAGQRLYVYDVKNVKAVDLAATLADVFGGGAGGGVRSGPPSGDRLMPGLEPVEIRTVGTGSNVSPSPGTNDPPKAVDSAADYSGSNAARSDAPGNGGGVNGPTVDASGGIALGASDEVRISASEENNALLIKATSGQWESIRRVIERLDTIPLQVHIEAKIIRVSLNDNLEFGVQWFFENGITSPGLLARSRTRNIWGDHAGSVLPTGTSWTFVGPGATAIINALDNVSETTVLSAPSLVVLNNKTANINVGQQIPVASSFYGGGVGTGPNNPNPGVNQQSYVQFRQTGITLDVTPRVNPGGLVFMEVDQTESAPGAGPVVGGNQSVDNRSIKTEVAVQSGQTLVLGGLIKTIEGKAKGGLPGLSRIPLIGGLFGNQTREESREELLVLITPRVITNGEEARRMTEEYSRRFRGIAPLRVRVEP